MLRESKARRIICLSRDEFKQSELKKALAPEGEPGGRLRLFLGDVRDLDRLRHAFYDVDVVIHAAALKQIDALEYNPLEALKTNCLGTWNVLQAATETGVSKVVVLSSDKACAALNTYGISKAMAERLALSWRAYTSHRPLAVAAVRYGNVTGSRGSVVPLWRKLAAEGRPLPITDPQMTRFWFDLNGSVDMVLWLLKHMRGSELLVPKLEAYRLVDLASAINPEGEATELIGCRPGEKRHEVMISADEGHLFTDIGDYFIRSAESVDGTPCPPEFAFSSNTAKLLSVNELRDLLRSIP
jgi:UDP-N-acetylglucosamine 4,6-dehydratase